MYPSATILVLLALSSSMAFAAEEPQAAVYSMGANGEDLEKQIQAPGYRAHGSPAWSNDGERLLFCASKGGWNSDDPRILLSNAKDSEPQDLGLGLSPSWSRDNKQIIFHVPKNSQRIGVGIWIMNADGKAREFLFAGSEARFSPDGGRIAYVSADRKKSIHTYELLTGTSKKALEHSFNKILGRPAWSPDGTKLCFVGIRESGAAELVIFDATGSENGFQKRASGNLLGSPAWEPGNTIIVQIKSAEDGPEQLHAIDPANQSSPVLLANQGLGKTNADPTWTVDGKRISFVSDRKP
jgi:Tol biopolymer transport system component